MSYYPTIEDDLMRADEMIQKGRGNGEGGTIYRADAHTAHGLLRSFVQYIRGYQVEREMLLDTIAKLTEARELAIRANHRAAEQIAAAAVVHEEYTARLASIPAPPQRLGPLPATHPAVNLPCPACWRPILVGAVVALVSIGPGDDPEERHKAAHGRPYTATAVVAHWECVTGQIED